jgi:alanine racemase
VLRTEVSVDLEAIRGNVELLRTRTTAEVMAVVKADGYGHGMLPAARAALAGGASWLGTATLDEALTLRRAAIDAPVLAWLWTSGEAEHVRDSVAADIDLSVSNRSQLHIVAQAARQLGRVARVHLKIDTGLSRNGSTPADWPELASAAAAENAVDVVGVWSHLANSDVASHPSNAYQLERFVDALDQAEREGVHPRWRHLANSAATLTLPDTHFDLVRPGIAVYGLSPVPQEGDFGLVPAMTLRAALASVKRVPAGEGVSYGHEYTTSHETTLVLVPLGYADGIPRNATNVAPVSVAGSRFTVSGRVSMDQFVVDVGDLAVSADDEALLFGPGTDGEPRAQDWADALGTIHYEIVTRIGARVARTYHGSTSA